jgi:hypothetical protein
MFVTYVVRNEHCSLDKEPAMSATAVALPETAAPPAETEPAPYRWRWVVLAIVLIAEVMDLLDSTVITIAAPTVRDSLGGSTTTM